MNNSVFKILLVMFTALVGVSLAAAQVAAETVTYGDIELVISGGPDLGHFSDVWDLTACEMTISFTYDGNGLVDELGSVAHAYPQLGVRAVGLSDYNPSHGGIWLAADFHNVANTFDPDPSQDIDDKLLLQRAAGQGEGAYNLPAVPPTPGASYRFWFDRDGVDPFQAAHPLAVDGGTYNTEGTYDVVLSLNATGANAGEAFMTVNGLAQGFETDGDGTTMELSPAGMTFTGNMAQMQIYYGLFGFGAQHSVAFRNITASGCRSDSEGPITSNTASSPNPVAVGTETAVTAYVDDSMTGSSPIAGAEYSLGGAAWYTMAAQDGVFDAIAENVTATFSAPDVAGFYSLCVRGVDAKGNYGDPACIELIVFDPTPFTTGGGWIDSPAEAATAGKAGFSFVARYGPGASVPSGNAQFVLKAADINLHATSFDWLIVTDGSATLQGNAVLNGNNAPNGNPYKFQIWAQDGSPDTFRIKIWYEDGGEVVVYDNGMDQAIGGGNIVVHTQ